MSFKLNDPYPELGDGMNYSVEYEPDAVLGGGTKRSLFIIDSKPKLKAWMESKDLVVTSISGYSDTGLLIFTKAGHYNIKVSKNISDEISIRV